MQPTELTAAAPRTQAAALGWIALVIVLAGLNLRVLLTTLGASLEAVRLDLGLSASAAGVLASIPTLCMGVVSLLGGWVIGHMGIGRGMKAALLLVAVGSAARWAGAERWVLYLATFVGGLGIACAQVLVPVVVKQFFPGRAALVMGGYTMAMNVGAAAGAAATPVLTLTLGGWAPALGAWALLALVAAALWPSWLRRRGGGDESLALPWGSAIGWRMAVFLGSGSVCYMALMAWLVPLYSAHGWTQAEGVALLTVFSAAQIGAALVVPPLASRGRDRRPALVATLAMLTAGLAGFWLSPLYGAALWASLTGIGLGGSFPLALTLPLDYTDTPTEAGRLSAMVLGLSMLLGAVGPSLFGLLRDAFGFGAALFFLTCSAAVSCLLGLSFRPPRIKENVS